MKNSAPIFGLLLLLLCVRPAGAQTPEAVADRADSSAAAPPVAAPTPASFLARADSLRHAYAFARAVEACGEGLALRPDSLTEQALSEEKMLAQNGLNMLGYCSQPVVVARERFSLEDFFLYYPLEDRAWHPLPNALDSLSRGFPWAMYIPRKADELYYSARDEDGIRNLYHSVWRDSVWAVPALLGEHLTSDDDEIFPMVSPDGRSLYFASSGLYGMGGYDLYVSRWNSSTHQWDVPVNLGFPYSSPYDDFLFVNTADGRHSIFASNRECSRDSVWVYVLEYDSMPVRKALEEGDPVRNLARLLPAGSASSPAAPALVPENQDIRRYMDKMALVRSLRDAIYDQGKSIDALRARLAQAPESARADIAADIVRQEAALPVLQDSLSAAVSALQAIEMEFLTSGVVIDPEQVEKEADREEAAPAYHFERRTLGPALRMKVLRPKPVFDYSFKILPQGRFAEDNTLPSGLVYQIQILSSSSKVTVGQLKGLSPVFQRMSPSLRYTCTVGIFRTYDDVLAHLNKVKKAGFRSAFIVAWMDGESVTVAKARELEQTVRYSYQIRIAPEAPLTESEIITIHALTRSDLSRSQENGQPVYFLGPYDDRVEADRLLSSLKAAGISGASLERR